MWRKEIIKFFATFSFNYFCHQINNSLKIDAIYHKWIKMFVYPIIDILSYQRKFIIIWKCSDAIGNGRWKIFHLCFQLKEIESYNNCLIWCTMTKYEYDKVHNVLNGLIWSHGNDRAINFIYYSINSVIVVIEG